MALHLDFETRSTVDLRKTGSDVYSRDPSTEIICVGLAWNNDRPRIMRAQNAFPFIKKCIDRGDMLVAHNARFEIDIWNNSCTKKHGWDPISADLFTCTMTLAFSMGLPGSLNDASAAVGIEIGKDMEGHRVMMQLCKPRDTIKGDPIWWTEKEHPEKYQKLYKYCAQDVEVERFLFKRLRQLNPLEKKIWVVDQKINDRGIGVDVKAAKEALDIVEHEKTRLNNLMAKVTRGSVPTCTSNTALLRWLNSLGIVSDSVDKASLSNILKRSGLYSEVRTALLLRREAAKTSTSKLKSMLEAQHEGRIRGTLQYHAAATGRWGGRKIQPQNFKRPDLKQEEIEEVFKILHNTKTSTKDKTDEIGLFFGQPMNVISSCLRGFLIPKEGCDYIGCDFKAIEAVITAWVAREECLLKLFRDREDPYIDAASSIYACAKEQIDSTRRQVGKVAVLSLGFGGGKGAFQLMAKGYGIKVSDDEAEKIKKAWRAKNPNVVSTWYALENAAIKAIRTGERVSVGKVSYKKNGSFLLCTLPSGRDIVYPYPKLELKDTPWNEKKTAITSMWVSSKSRKWERRTLWYGILMENVVQGIARDVLVNALMNFEGAGYETVMHVHDEVLLEVEKGVSSPSTVENIAVMSPQWGPDIPIDAEAWRGVRYQK